MNVVAFIVSMVVFVFGFWLFGLAFEVADGQFWIFLAGLVSVSVAVAIPVQILRD